MPDQTLTPILWQAFCAVLGALICVLAYLGTQINGKLNDLCRSLAEISKASHDDYARLDVRVTRIETRCQIEHNHE